MYICCLPTFLKLFSVHKIQKVEKLQEHLAAEMERNVEETSGTDITPFRHQAELIARKKGDVAQRYTEAKAKLEKLEEELKASKDILIIFCPKIIIIP